MPDMDINEVWNAMLESIQERVTRPSFETWLRHTKPLGAEGSTIVVGVPNQFARDWVESRWAPLIRETLQSMLGQQVQLKFVIPPGMQHAATTSDTPDQVTPPPRLSPVAASGPLNPKYTFETFVVGNSNRFAHAACLAVAEAPAKAYNPLFIYGGVGLGKTHLMQAVAHFVLEHSPHMKVVYVSSETFTNELISSIRDGRTADFRNRYRRVDVLLVDDIQFVAGKESTQEEFFHTFDALHAANKQIVISSDRPPKEIATLEDRLRSRFEWGLISDIQPPDLETRVAILRKKASLEGLRVPDDVLLYIATHIETNIRELEGALIRLVAYSSLTRQSITLDLATEVLKDILPALKPEPVTIRLIQEVVCQHYELPISEMTSKKRTRAVVLPRQVAMYLCRELTDASLPKIGEEFGGRDHTTVLHAYEKISQEAARDPGLRKTLEQLKEKIKRA